MEVMIWAGHVARLEEKRDISPTIKHVQFLLENAIIEPMLRNRQIISKERKKPECCNSLTYLPFGKISTTSISFNI
jgi:hypothetical protein